MADFNGFLTQVLQAAGPPSIPLVYLDNPSPFIPKNPPYTAWTTVLDRFGAFGFATPTQGDLTNGINSFLDRSFYQDFYNRILVIPDNFNVGNLVTTLQRTFEVWNGFNANSTLTGIVQSNTAGIILTGNVAPGTWAPLESRIYTATITTDGPPTIDSSFTFNFAAPRNDVTVRFSGRRIIALPYPFRPGMTEAIEWLTDVQTANDGSETLVQLRRAPRHQVSGTAYIAPSELSRADNLMYGWRDRTWALPRWQEVRQASATTELEQTITVNTENADFRVGGLGILWQNWRTFEVFEVQGMTTSEITTRSPLTLSLANPLCMPVYPSRMLSDPRRRTNGASGDLALNFEAVNNLPLSGTVTDADLTQQYLGRDVLLKEPLLTGRAITDTYNRRIDTVDNDTGLVSTRSPWLNVKTGRTFRYILEGQGEIWQFRQWLHRRKGRAIPFWMPTFESNFRIYNPEGGPFSAAIEVLKDEYPQFGADRNHLAIQYTNGTWSFHEVTSSGELDNFADSLLISPTLSNVERSSILQICQMGVKRLGADVVNFEYEANNVVIVSVQILEIEP